MQVSGNDFGTRLLEFSNGSDLVTLLRCVSMLLQLTGRLQVLGQVPQLQVWTGPDLRNRWPSFARQLGELDREAEKRAAAPAPAPRPAARLARVVEGDSGLGEASVPDLMGILAARGITVQRS